MEILFGGSNPSVFHFFIVLSVVGILGAISLYSAKRLPQNNFMPYASFFVAITLCIAMLEYQSKFTDCRMFETTIEATNSAGDSYRTVENVRWCSSREHLSLPFSTYEMYLE